MIAPNREPGIRIVGHSLETREALRLVGKAGGNRFPVLLLGETGTGKDVIARAIHQANPLGPFVTIDCASLVGPLMESELFGHVRGAFTGAAASKIGLIETASGGTAFLDEIGELPHDLQAKLLRVLQEKEFRPVGSLTPRKSDFRVIAATNRDLAREVERGNFRQDLYYRLKVVTIRLAPLRDRRDDIPLLAEHFLNRYGRNHSLTRETLDAMLGYDWPGNVRELENCILHMVAVNTGPLLHLADLPSSLQNFLRAKTAARASMAMAAGARGAAAEVREAAALPQTPSVVPLVELEKNAIMNALAYTRGDRGVAAALLGIGRTTLYRKLKEYQLADS